MNHFLAQLMPYMLVMHKKQQFCLPVRVYLIVHWIDNVLSLLHPEMCFPIGLG